MLQVIERTLRSGGGAALVWLAATSAGAGVDLPREIERLRASVKALPASDLVSGEQPRMLASIDDAEAMTRAGRPLAALETLASVAPGIPALARASSGWKETDTGPGKGLDALQKEWTEVGVTIRSDRAAFAATRPGRQSAFTRALAEQSFGQVDEHYVVAVDYGRFSGLSAGAYYLGRAEGQMSWALTLARSNDATPKAVASPPALDAALARLENDIVEAYAKPGSTAQHTNFIIANSSLKLARELETHGLRLGALVTLLRSRLALALATTAPPAAERQKELRASAATYKTRLHASARDESIGESLIEKALAALDKSEDGNEASARERLRAAALLDIVVPTYLDIMKGANP